MYQPKPAPADTDAYTVAELQSIAQAQSDPVDFVQLNVLHKAPKKPREGMVVCADGSDWQPLAAGGGFFGYFGGAWKKLNN